MSGLIFGGVGSRSEKELKRKKKKKRRDISFFRARVLVANDGETVIRSRLSPFEIVFELPYVECTEEKGTGCRRCEGESESKKKVLSFFFFLEERKVVVERAEGFFFLALQSQALIF